MREEIIEYSRTAYSHPRAEVEAAIAKWREPIAPKYEERRPEIRPQKKSPFPSQDVARPKVQPTPGKASLSDLVKQAVPEKPKATGTSAQFISNADLKILIAKALGKNG